jgi:4-amino-4-deoxy-L-arabinose transferase-like glycosyltransferase
VSQETLNEVQVPERPSARAEDSAKRQAAAEPLSLTDARRARSVVIASWVASLLILLAGIGLPPVQRTQEARVLVTAREMFDSGGDRWLIPRMNGELRLEKPPLAYWLSAVSFASAGGVSEAAGRVPFALCGWLTIGLTYAFASHAFASRRAGWFAAASLLGGMFFYRHARLAETDILATFFVTAAVYSIWRGAGAYSWRRWFLASGVATGLAVLAKGPPAGFALVFLVAIAAERRDWSILWRWARSGAPIVALLIGAPWYAYVAAQVGVERFAHELKALAGEEHTGSPFNYLPQLLRATPPWTGFAIAAIVAACTQFRAEPQVRPILLWAASVFVPLLVIGQRQFHYLLPMMPALAVLNGWLLLRATRPEDDARTVRWVRAILLLTIACCAIGALFLPSLARRNRGETTGGDLLVAAALLAGALLAWRIVRSRGLLRGLAAFALIITVAMPVLQGAWFPTLSPNDTRVLGRAVRAAAREPGGYCFYGSDWSMPLAFELRTIVPLYTTEPELAAAVKRDRGLVVIVERKRGAPAATTMPSFLEPVERFVMSYKGQVFEIYRAQP